VFIVFSNSSNAIPGAGRFVVKFQPFLAQDAHEEVIPAASFAVQETAQTPLEAKASLFIGADGTRVIFKDAQ
jgi:hypothetical protein